MDDEKLTAQLTDMKAAIMMLADRMSKSMNELETTASAFEHLSNELKETENALAKKSTDGVELPDSVLSMPLKVEAILASHARLTTQFEAINHALGQLALAIESNKQSSGKAEATKEMFSAALDEKLIHLAKLEAEILEQTRRNGNALEKLVENQNQQNEVLGATLEVLIKYSEKIREDVEKLPTEKTIEKAVEKDIAEKLNG